MTETTEIDRPDETATLSLSHHEAQLLEAQLASDLARIEEALDRAHEGRSVLAEQLEQLRRLDERLQRLLQEFEPLPDIL